MRQEEYLFVHSRKNKVYKCTNDMHSREKELYNFMRQNVQVFSQERVI
jgi:hypothetical protein